MKITFALVLLSLLVGCAGPALNNEPVTKLDWQCAPVGTSSSLRCVPKAAEPAKTRAPSNSATTQKPASLEKYN